MIGDLPATDAATAARIVEIQQAAYSVEAGLIGFDGIPALHESAADIMARTDLTWRGATVDGRLAGLIAWLVDTDGVLDIDRLAVDPAYARRGLGRALVRAVPAAYPITVSTGAANEPAIALYLGEGFRRVGEHEVAPGVFLARFRRR